MAESNLTPSISEQIEKEAEARYGKLFNAAPTSFWGCNELIKHCMDSFLAGASFRESLGKEGGVKELLKDFFLWFRNEGGEANLGKSVEKMIDTYLNSKK